MTDMKHFHAHIYFEPEARKIALLWSMRAELAGLFELVNYREQPVGPHATGMIEAHFSESAHGRVLEWLRANRGSFSVLIHQDTGDDFKDHTDGIKWLGKELPLKFDFFERVQKNPELRIHK